ncbi:MAG: BtaA family protein [Gracilibacteraceae bacterium]|jgi:S-adenosylmethionine-diacylglycerol 3-amino-3-carboxypropyl transferase|nr:BtaA family protein [Gracilibacteraceae bacterium]
MADIGERAKFDYVRYAQCWEDADILLEALNPAPKPQQSQQTQQTQQTQQCQQSHTLSIASGGENSFSLLAGGGKVTAVDLSLPQLAVCALKREAYRQLDYPEFLAFLGVKPSPDRLPAYRRLAGNIEPQYRTWLEANLPLLEGGIVHCGKFEHYFKLFRRRILPLIHSPRTVARLLAGSPDRAERRRFYESGWNNLRYRLLFRVFFSRRVMGRAGRDTAFFDQVRGGVAGRIKRRVKDGLIEVNGPDNPYLHYILTGNYGAVLPHALRPENFAAIKANAGNLTMVQAPVEAALAGLPDGGLTGFNLSDIFEYMDPGQMNALYARLLAKAAPEARLVYWNMLVPREADRNVFAGQIRRLDETAAELLLRDKAFFYSRLIIEEKL